MWNCSLSGSIAPLLTLPLWFSNSKVQKTRALLLETSQTSEQSKLSQLHFFPGSGFFLELYIFSYMTHFSTESCNEVLNCEQRSVRLSQKLHVKVIQVSLQRLNSLKKQMEFNRGIGLDDLQMSLPTPTTLRNNNTNLRGNHLKIGLYKSSYKVLKLSCNTPECGTVGTKSAAPVWAVMKPLINWLC